MEELKEAATHCGLDGADKANFAVGGFLSVLKKSKKLSKEQNGAMDKILASLRDDTTNNNDTNTNNITAAEESIQEYEKVTFRDAMPKPGLSMLLPRPDFAPPGPPPWVIGKALSKGIKKATRKDKDAGNTEEMVELVLRKCEGVQEESLLKFMQVFIVFVEEKAHIDVSDILCLPETNDGKQQKE